MYYMNLVDLLYLWERLQILHPVQALVLHPVQALVLIQSGETISELEVTSKKTTYNSKSLILCLNGKTGLTSRDAQR